MRLWYFEVVKLYRHVRYCCKSLKNTWLENRDLAQTKQGARAHFNMITITQPWKITGSIELNDGWSVGCIYVYYFLPPFQGNLRLLLPGGGSCTSWWADYNPSYYNNVRNDLCDSSRANGLSCLNILYLAQWPLNSRVCIHFLVSIFYFLQRLLSNNTNLIFSFLCFGGFSHYCFFACLLTSFRLWAS